jgi:hypothetical protein
VSAALARAPVRWIGPLHVQADDAFRRARVAGLSYARACVVGQIASFKDGWVFRSRLADAVGVCVRTVQRGITQARELGMMRTARSKPRERPPGAGGPLVCGFSHRWILAPAQAAAAAASHLARKVARSLCEAKPATCDGQQRIARPANLAERAARARAELAELVARWEDDPPPKPA